MKYKTEKRLFVHIALVILAVCSIIFGVYALRTASAGTTGTVRFMAGDCKLSLYGTITGAVSSVAKMGPSANEVFYFGSEQSPIAINGTKELTFADDLKDVNSQSVPTIYFNDMGLDSPSIVMTLNFKNNSGYNIGVNVANVSAGDGVTALTTSKTNIIVAGGTGSAVFTFTVSDFSANLAVPNNFNLAIQFLRDTSEEYLHLTESVGMEYEANYKGSEIESYTLTSIGECEDSGINIPSEHLGKPVTKVLTTAFKDAYNDLTGSSEVLYTFDYVFIPETVTEIVPYTFVSNIYLGMITIPVEVEDQTICFFTNKYIVSERNKNFSSLNGVLYNKDRSKLISYPCGDTNESFVIPATVTEIADGAFFWQSHLTNLSFEENSTLDNIGYGAFAKMINLNNLTFATNNTFKKIKTFTFWYTGYKYSEDIDTSIYNLELTIPKSVEVIEKAAFCDCGIKSISFEKNSRLTTLETFAMGMGYVNLVTLPDTIKNLSAGCFGLSFVTNISFEEGCQLETANSAFQYSMAEALILPKSFTTLPDGIFAGMTAGYIKTITIKSPTVPTVDSTSEYWGIPNSVTKIYIAQGTKSQYLADPAWAPYSSLFEEVNFDA